MLQGSGALPHDEQLHRARRPLLRFAMPRGRLTGMPALALMVPSIALSRAVDPLRLALDVGQGEPADVAEVRRHAGARIEELLAGTGLGVGIRWSRSRWGGGGDGVRSRPVCAASLAEQIGVGPRALKRCRLPRRCRSAA
jgi:hypothetical protein